MDCPSEKTLADYVTGIASSGEASCTAQHVESCDRCRCAVEWLQSYPQPHDTDDSELYDETTGLYYGNPTNSFDSQSLNVARFDPSIFGPAETEEALGTLDKYEVTKVLGCGGMGVVFRAFDLQLRRPVAIKILNQELAVSQIARRRFIREARAAAAINHANVVTIYSVEEDHEPPLLAMELVQGKSLRDHIREQRQVEPIEALRITVQVAYGLAAAHAHGVIHRDIKPGNIMLEEGVQRVKLTDFGLARAAIDNVDLTAHDAAVGTPAYMAPEQVLGEPIDSRADLFALGCVIHAMLTGYSPFHGRTSWQIASRVTDWNPPPLSESHPAVPPFLSEIVEKLLQKNPDDRFQSAMEVAELINAHLAMINQTRTDEIQQMAAGDSPWPKPQLKRQSKPSYRRALWILATASLVLALIAVGIASRSLLFPPASTPVLPAPDAEPAGAGDIAPAPAQLLSEITVAQAGAEFNSISLALERAAPGAIIRVVDSAEYATPLVINDERWRGVQLIAEQQATLKAPTDSVVIRIDATPDVVIRGFRMEVALEQHGIEVTGDCPGLQILDLGITRFDESIANPASVALFHLHGGAMGTAEKPILFESVKVRDGNIGINIGEHGENAASRPLTGWIEVRNCDMAAAARAVGYHVIIAARTENVQISNNLFATAACGVSLSLREPNQTNNITIKKNTYYDLGSLFAINNSNLAQGEVTFHENLIHGDMNPVHDGRASVLPDYWFQDNYWLQWPKGSDELRPIAQPWSGYSFMNTAPSAADYLRLQADSPENERPRPFPGRDFKLTTESAEEPPTN